MPSAICFSFNRFFSETNIVPLRTGVNQSSTTTDSSAHLAVDGDIIHYDDIWRQFPCEYTYDADGSPSMEFKADKGDRIQYVILSTVIHCGCRYLLLSKKINISKGVR